MILHHLTVNTAHLYQSPRDGASREAVDMLLPVIDAGGGRMGESGWDLRLLVRRPGAAAWQIEAPDMGKLQPYVVGIQCGAAAEADEAWRQVGCFASSLRLTMPPRPSLPWLAVTLTPWAELLDIEDLQALADAERTIAWAIMEADGWTS